MRYVNGTLQKIGDKKKSDMNATQTFATTFSADLHMMGAGHNSNALRDLIHCHNTNASRTKCLLCFIPYNGLNFLETEFK